MMSYEIYFYSKNLKKIRLFCNKNFFFFFFFFYSEEIFERPPGLIRLEGVWDSMHVRDTCIAYPLKPHCRLHRRLKGIPAFFRNPPRPVLVRQQLKTITPPPPLLLLFFLAAREIWVSIRAHINDIFFLLIF